MVHRVKTLYDSLNRKRNRWIMADIQQLIRDLIDPEQKKSAAARDALLALKSEAIVPLLATLDQQEVSLRMAAAHLLLHFDDARALPKVLDLSRDHEDNVRNWLSARLAMLKQHPLVIETLLTVAREDSQPYIRQTALRSLDKLGAQAAATDIRLEMLKSGNEQVVREVVMELGNSGDRRVIDPLLELLNQRPPHLVFGFVVNALTKLRDSRVFDVITPYLTSTDPYQRAVVAQALGDLGDPRAIAILRPLVNDSAFAWQDNHGPTESVGDVTKQALKKLGHEPEGKGKPRPWWKIW
jgi:HEAT repeat protein